MSIPFGRSIPAGAGKTRPKGGRHATTEVYPRGCGENMEDTGLTRATVGLSPRVRGKPRGRGGGARDTRSIPAGAGKTSTGPNRGAMTTVYPRGCGENSAFTSSDTRASGLSPRVRGKRSLGGRSSHAPRSIPAGAGKTPQSASGGVQGAVYPRGCGENAGQGKSLPRNTGLSPRVRGKRRAGVNAVVNGRSIPAGAGKTFENLRTLTANEVYPRGCGENSSSLPASVRSRGLSPRVRGKPLRAPRAAFRARSIPAGAGKTQALWAAREMDWVYPRGCGENERVLWGRGAAEGLSPRVRGKPRRIARADTRERSIPAGAGKTPEGAGACAGGVVYPRGCGENTRSARAMCARGGLSPRVRGKPHRGEHGEPRPRSIPAGAGKTTISTEASPKHRVYPRGCGENASTTAPLAMWKGLSPRVRGKHSYDPARTSQRRSIPAGAGKTR